MRHKDGDTSWIPRRCRRCGRPILYSRLGDKIIILDPYAPVYRCIGVVDGIIRVERAEADEYYTTHSRTCPARMREKEGSP